MDQELTVVIPEEQTLNRQDDFSFQKNGGIGGAAAESQNLMQREDSQHWDGANSEYGDESENEEVPDKQGNKVSQSATNQNIMRTVGQENNVTHSSHGEVDEKELQDCMV